MVQVTFLQQWDRFQPGDTRIIESTLAARLILSGIVVQSVRLAKKEIIVVEPEPVPIVIEPKFIPGPEPPKPKRISSDKRSKPSQKKKEK